MTLATLPMYDLPELRPATDALWAAIAVRLRARGVAAPEALSRGTDLQAIWTDHRLLLGQTCGYPLMTSLARQVAVVATPVYLAAGCDGAYYSSALIVRATESGASLAEFRGRRCAVNDPASNSGMNVLRAAIAPIARGATRFFAEIMLTGAHVASVAAVAGGHADLAAIDCVTWAHLKRWRPEATGKLRVLAWTAAMPGLPLITASGTPDETRRILADVLDEVAADPALADVRATLLLGGFLRLGADAYERVVEVERGAVAVGYPVLC
jgi:ABC-type phosphate/phosphonate transport system substrate-binding protein